MDRAAMTKRNLNLRGQEMTAVAEGASSPTTDTGHLLVPVRPNMDRTASHTAAPTHSALNDGGGGEDEEDEALELSVSGGPNSL